MPTSNRSRRRRSRTRRPALVVALVAALLTLPPPAFAADAPSPAPAWSWPTAGAREVVEPFRAPAHDYGPGHRGIDIRAGQGATVTAPEDGVVAFRGVVVDRPLLTIDHGEGYVSTFEPLASDLAPGAVVRAGDEIGTVAVGGHAPAGTLHVGVRLNDVYINPMLLFGGVPRAVLLPCCASPPR
ncbi:M23 family metallopeptidase [Microbacterium sp. YMB-B2]|uniref:M23 family metallopeptidase n=1 Tax=Microbacterium tenebrionis TaxID=2830665 RepID=A0A9X1LQ67_9MICO|nr:M23 family metallopeptidase [Microbacterium tenebrionis]